MSRLIMSTEKALFKLKFPDTSAENETPPAVAISLARSTLLTSSREQLLQSEGSPFPLPHFCL
ncbi:hypothetical protein CU097_011654 [Rhizopus azygosporus]|uniref:Uncharacterized protein n=1 Tax=Rhizopus azygosporus TaxID=86630 RepID=A0A367JFP8_RHIAZ|nr:hypothetical protein CU097_011654 [Rhizopus azygosporus]